MANIWASILLLAALAPVHGAEAEAPPPGGEVLFRDLDYGAGWKAFGAVTVGEGTRDADGRRPVRISVARAGGGGIELPFAQDITKGQVFALGFRIRCIASKHESQQGFFSLSLREVGAPWRTCVGRSTTSTAAWHQVWARGIASGNMPAGTVKLQLQVGSLEQTLELDSVTLLRYPEKTDLASLPQTKLTYAGREAGAAWRVAAKERAKLIHSAPLSIQVVDRSGRPLPSVRVDDQQISNVFSTGVAMSAQGVRKLQDGQIARLRELFDMVVFHNDLKWDAMSGDWDGRVDRTPINLEIVEAMRLLKERGFSVRGHVMLWPGYGERWGNLPRYIYEARNSDADVVKRLVMARIDEVSAFGSPYIDEWDVVNEVRHNHALFDKCGMDFMVDVFKRARMRLPATRLAINDFDIISSPTSNNSQNEYESMIKRAISDGAPIDVIGMQGHFGEFVPSPEQMLKVLDRFGSLGPKIRVTEATFAGDDIDLKCDFLRDLLLVLYSHPKVSGILFWNGQGDFIDADWGLTRLGNVFADFKEAILTREVAQTDANGNASIPAFFGRHRITVTGNDVKKTLEIDHVAGSAPVIVTIP